MLLRLYYSDIQRNGNPLFHWNSSSILLWSVFSVWWVFFMNTWFQMSRCSFVYEWFCISLLLIHCFFGELLCCGYTWFFLSIWHQHAQLVNVFTMETTLKFQELLTFQWGGGMHQNILLHWKLNFSATNHVNANAFNFLQRSIIQGEKSINPAIGAF